LERKFNELLFAVLFDEKSPAVQEISHFEGVAQNKLHHKIPNFFRFIFQFLDPGYLKLIHYEKRI